MIRSLLFAGVIVSLNCCPVLAGDASLNLPSTFDPLKTKLASGQTGNVVVIGDSLSFRPGSWLYPFQAAVQSSYGNAGAGYQGMSLWTGGGFDAGWNNGQVNQDTAPHHSLDGLWASTNAVTDGYLVGNNPTYQLQYVAQPGGGSFQPFYWSGSGTVLIGNPINTAAAASSVQTLDLNTAGIPNGQIWFKTDGSGPVLILGANNTSSTPGVRISRAANGGWGVQNFLQRDWTFDSQLKLLTPDLYFVMLGQNDQSFGSAGSYKAAIEQLVTRLQAATPDAKICLVSNYDSSPGIAPLAQGMNDAATEMGLGFINLFQDAGSYDFFTSNGYLADGIHFSDAGGNYVGNLMFNAFQTDGQSLVPEPMTGGLLLIASCVLGLRRRRC